MTIPASIHYRILTAFPEPPLELKWRAFLSDADFPSGLVMPDYFLDSDRTGTRRFAVLALAEEEVLGVLTGIIEGRMVSSGLPVRPQLCCRASADQDLVARALASGVSTVGSDAKLITLHTWAPLPGFERAGFRAKRYQGEEGLIVLDLRKGPEALFAAFSQTRRNEIRKAIKLGVTVSPLATAEEFEEYYAIHVAWCRQKQIVPASFQAVKQSFERTEVRSLLLAKHEGKVLAGSVFRCCPRGIVEYVANFSEPENLLFKPNGLLVWRAIEWAHREGFRLFSLGAAHPFLQRFGSEFQTTYRYQRDQTPLRKYVVLEMLGQLRRRVARRLPASTRKAIKRVLRLR